MDLSELQNHLQTKPGATMETPFGPQALVYKVAGKVFALLAWEASPLRINLKCAPDQAEVLRAMYPAVQPGYHMNKRHWNTVTLDGSIDDDVVREMLDYSYDLVVKGMTRSARGQLLADLREKEKEFS